MSPADPATDTPADLEAVGAAFGIEGVFVDGSAWGSGHINDTFVCTWQAGWRRRRWVHQRINQTVFSEPETVMENVVRVTEHLRRRLRAAGVPDVHRRVLEVVPTRQGEPLWRDERGDPWRTYPFIEGARTLESPRGPGHAREAARAFGRFLDLLRDLPGPPPAETVAGFHDTPARLEALADAAQADPLGRLEGARPEVDALLGREDLAGALFRAFDAGRLPRRITHNDTKVNNVLVDDRTGEGLCVIDLDTVMPGLTAYDFGELVRTATGRAAEDETDVEAIVVDLEIFEALARGYLAGTGGLLTGEEKGTLTVGGLVMTLENATRFLTDHLVGDTYFKVHRPGHNLDRCRAQLALLRRLEARRRRMERTVQRAVAETVPD